MQETVGPKVRVWKVNGWDIWNPAKHVFLVSWKGTAIVVRETAAAAEAWAKENTHD